MSHCGLSQNTSTLKVKLSQVATFLLYQYQIQMLASTLINFLTDCQSAKNFIFLSGVPELFVQRIDVSKQQSGMRC
jgi:hypothetical protein